MSLGGKDIHFISKSVSEEDIDLFFGPIEEDDIFVTIQDHWTMAHIMNEAKIFKSISQARKNGESKPIPNGFNYFVRGKMKQQIYILNIA